MIPKTAHYCWYGPAPFTPLGSACMASWRRVLPDFRFELWDETRLDQERPYVRLAYAARKFAFVADYMRLVALYECGGVYFDTDIEVLRRMDDLLAEPMFMGFERKGVIGVSVIGARRGHPFLRAILDKLDAEARTGRLSFRPLPDVVTELASEVGTEGVCILPDAYFYPYNPYSSDPLRKHPLQSNITEDTRCIHHWEGSWLQGITLHELFVRRIQGLWYRSSRPSRPSRQARIPS